MQPQRTQYPFGALTDAQQKSIIGVNRPLAYRITLQNQWDVFERVENYNDIMYQRYQTGDRSQTYYQFKNDQEFKDYKSGQQLHVNAYPSLPISTFQPVTNRPMPDVPIIGSLPYETNVPRFAINKLTPTASEQAVIAAENEIYAYVSTYNGTHVLKYQFVDDIEKNAYERADLRLNTTT
jgi:hypothetical protein